MGLLPGHGQQLSLPGGLLGGLAFAQLPLGQAVGGDVLDGLNDELHLPGRVEHGRVARLPVALHEPAGLRRVGHVVMLRGHFVRLAGGHYLGERGAHVGHGVGLGSLGVIRKSVENELPDDSGPLGQGCGQVVVAGAHYHPLRRQQQRGARLGIEDGQ